MEIGIIGASAAGLYTAILLLRKHSNWKVCLYDRMDKAGKKVLATGNGHCNLLHAPFRPEAFNHPEFVAQLLRTVPEVKMKQTLWELGVPLTEKGELLYPLTYSAASYVHLLVETAERLGATFCLGETVIGIHDKEVTTDKGKRVFDAIVFAFGGKSQSNLGSDGSMFGVLAKEGYPLTAMRPSLCPIRSRDVPKSLFGVRHSATVTMSSKGKTLYRETGEILFKKDGLSGIAIMNASAYFEEGAILFVDLFPEYTEARLEDLLLHQTAVQGASFLAGILEKPLAEYVAKKTKNAANSKPNTEKIREIAHYLKNMPFVCDGLYDFDSSQVTRGGIALDAVDGTLKSKVCPNHHFVGECLDIDGLCGGFNLGFALLSAMVVVEAL